MSSQHTTRRRFIQQSTLALAASAMAPQWVTAAENSPTNDGGVPLRPLGKTGVDVAMLGLGGHHFGQIKNERTAIKLGRRAIDKGVTFLDNAWCYHGGRSEERMGQMLQDGYREKVFLMTKHHGRKTKAEAMEQLETSLKRLKTDHIDLWQFHEIGYQQDIDWIFGDDGAIAAADQAKQDGKVRFIGFTGHKYPEVLSNMMVAGYEWDAVQMPVNPFDPHYHSFIKGTVPYIVDRGAGVIAMKTMGGGGGNLLRSGAVTYQDCLNFAWSQPVSTIVCGMTTNDMVDQNVAAAQSFQPMSQEAIDALLAKTAEPAKNGRHEPYKASIAYDGPVSRELHGT
ncbi:aldo/keto reductase [Cerasicoccus fimbriatus]|uniref:aldo/keto reductase n=1 Tax=Cerasicoccus fimbriatus TaxID=3014554 RepID=UPI0022B37377|nr:aldo/keto reductase [Cerasicoccus sp. TK19100]